MLKQSPKAKVLITIIVALFALQYRAFAQNLLPEKSVSPQAVSGSNEPDNPVYKPGEFVSQNSVLTLYQIELQSEIVTAYPENNRMKCLVAIPKSANSPMPVVIAIHYWGTVDVENEKNLAKRLAAGGIATVIIELPFHLSRTPAGFKSGELAVQPDVRSIKRMMLQSSSDISTVVDWIISQKEFDGQKIGLVGSSLGGIVGSLAFATDSRISAYASLLGGVDLTEMIWTSSRLVRQRDVLRRQGVTRASLKSDLEEVEPLYFLRKEDNRPVFVIGAKFDSVVSPKSYKALHNATGNSQILWLDTGHYGGFLVQSSVFRSIVKFFEATFTGEVFIPPGRLYAPTIRLVAVSNAASGLQVGLGLDIWRNTSQGDLFGSLIFTPTGVQGMFGARVSEGLTLGFSILPRRTSVGAMWSFVL